MAQFLIPLSNLLHTLATILFVGYYALMVTLVIPILSAKGPTGMQALSELSKCSRWWLYGALAIFAVTGVYLTISDANYSGIGKFDSTWSILMLMKHIIILVILAIGFWFNAIKRVGPAMLSTSNSAAGLTRFTRYCTLMTICGFLVLVITAIGQMQ
jgi:uncharacterized membrane protein